jgi:hypothetical protein
MTIPMVGILIVVSLILVLGFFCMISDILQRRRDETYDEVPEGYWDELKKYLVERPSSPPGTEDDDPEPIF